MKAPFCFIFLFIAIFKSPASVTLSDVSSVIVDPPSLALMTLEESFKVGANSDDYGAQISQAGTGVGLKINSTSTGHIMQLQDNGTDVMVVEDGGNVAIGQSPGKKLDIDGDVRIRGDSGTLNFYRTTSPTDVASIEYNHSDLTLKFWAKNKAINFSSADADQDTAHLYIKGTTGEVGIGTGSPSSILNLHNGTGSDGDGARETKLTFSGEKSNGSVKRTGSIKGVHDGTGSDDLGRLEFEPGEAGTKMTIDSSGNVGIGITPESGISADASSLQVGDLLSFSAWTGANANDFHALSYNAYKTGSDSWKAQRTSSSADYRPSQYAQAYGQHYFRVATSATADSAISFSNAMTIDNSGNVEINDGDLKIGTAGHGIEFNSGGDSSLLDDYEEGTYNPSITGSSTAASGVNFSSRHGEYTKIGNIIHVSIHINMTSYTSGPTGTSLWCTLPFSAHSTHVPAATVGYTANWDRRPVAGIVAGGTDRLYLYVSDVSSSSNVTAGTGVTNATGDDINGTSEIFLQASYSMH